MTLEEKIVATLKTNLAVSALVGTRIFPVVMEEKGAWPRISYQRISGGFISSLSGYCGLEHPRIQVDCWARSYSVAKELAVKVRAAMAGAASFQSRMISDQDFYEPDVNIYRVSLDFYCWHGEG